MMDIPEKLRKIRTIRELKQSELADISGVSRGMISDIECGRASNPSVDVIRKLSRALRVSPMYFLEESAATPFDVEEIDTALPPELRKLLLKEEFLPYLVLGERAFKEKIPPHVIQNIIESIRSVMNNPDK